MGTITGANAIVMLTIPGVFPQPQQLQGFAADDVFDTDAIESAETVMGVDGRLSAGFVYVPVNQTYALQADSESTFVFDNWWAANQVAQDVFRANGVVLLKAVGKKWTLTNGALTSYKPIPDTKKLLQPQRYRITWERIFPAPV
jgi:hypothetical protein